MLVSNKLKEQLLESAIKQEYTGLKLLDAYIAYPYRDWETDRKSVV